MTLVCAIMAMIAKEDTIPLLTESLSDRRVNNNSSKFYTKFCNDI